MFGAKSSNTCTIDNKFLVQQILLYPINDNITTYSNIAKYLEYVEMNLNENWCERSKLRKKCNALICVTANITGCLDRTYITVMQNETTLHKSLFGSVCTTMSYMKKTNMYTGNSELSE